MICFIAEKDEYKSILLESIFMPHGNRELQIMMKYGSKLRVTARMYPNSNRLCRAKDLRAQSLYWLQYESFSIGNVQNLKQAKLRE